MNTHHKYEKPNILLNFDNIVYKDGKNFSISLITNKCKAPKISKNLKLLLESYKEKFTVILYTKHMLEATLWAVENKLDIDCIHSVSRKKLRTNFYIERL